MFVLKAVKALAFGVVGLYLFIILSSLFSHFSLFLDLKVQHPKIGRWAEIDGPKSKLAEVKLAEVEIGRTQIGRSQNWLNSKKKAGQNRNWPKSIALEDTGGGTTGVTGLRERGWRWSKHRHMNWNTGEESSWKCATASVNQTVIIDMMSGVTWSHVVNCQTTSTVAIAWNES